jgi:autoinducer 2-degrading protein
MIAMLVTIKVKPGQEKVFENRIKIHRELVRKNEPGNRFYELTKKRDQPGVYIMWEMYDAAADFEQHQKMPYFEETMRICGAATIGEPQAEILDVVL